MTTFTIHGNTDQALALANASAKRVGPAKVLLIDAYASVDRSIWYDIVAACLNDRDVTEQNKNARYWRASAKKHIAIAGIPAVVDYLFTEKRTESFTTLAKTYCPELYSEAKSKTTK